MYVYISTVSHMLFAYICDFMDICDDTLFYFMDIWKYPYMFSEWMEVYLLIFELRI